LVLLLLLSLIPLPHTLALEGLVPDGSVCDIVHVQDADVLKVTDEEAEWLFGIPADEALEDPTRVWNHPFQSLSIESSSFKEDFALDRIGPFNWQPCLLFQPVPTK
jgi:hypothetical protein